MADPVRYQLTGGVATLTMDRPDTLNALDLAMKESLVAAVQRAGSDPEVRAVVLTGAGRAFCVGQDLREHAAALAADPDSVGRTVREHYNRIALGLAGMPKPVVAAVNGTAAGAGASFAFACDFRLAADSARFLLAFAGIGLAADSGASWTLPRLVGHGRATALLMLAEPVSADAALQMGLVNAVVPASSLADAVAELAARLAAGPTRAYAAIKEQLAFGADHDLAAALATEAELQGRAGRTEDHRKATEAFVAKQRPTFQGR